MYKYLYGIDLERIVFDTIRYQLELLRWLNWSTAPLKSIGSSMFTGINAYIICSVETTLRCWYLGLSSSYTYLS